MEKHTRKKILGGYPAVGVVISTTLALFVFGLFGNLMMYSKQFAAIVRENVNVQVYLKGSLTETQRSQLESTILAQDFIAPVEKAVEFVSKEDAEKDLVAEIGDYRGILGENPLKDAFKIKIKPELQDTTNLKAIRKQLEGMRGVHEVTYEQGLVEDVNRNIRNVSLYLLTISVLLLITTFILVNNTLKLALFSQRFLIRSMQLVGARQFFILTPFLIRSLGYGLLSGVLAGSMLWALSDWVKRKFIPEIAMLHDMNDFIIMIAALIAMGVLVSCLSTYFAIRKYLKMSLDDLY